MKLPVIPSRDLINILGKVCFKLRRQRGSHIILIHADPPRREVVIPNHVEIKRGTLCSILAQAGLNRDDFFNLYYKHKRVKDGQDCG